MASASGHSVFHRNSVLRRPARVSAAVVIVAVGTCAAVATAGCSSAPTKSSGKGAVDTSTETAATSKALQLAAAATERIKSLTATITVHSSNTGAGNLTGDVAIQLKPTKIIEAMFNVAPAKSGAIQLDEILTSKAIYFKDPAFTKAAGKPWVKAGLSDISSKVGVSLGSLLQNLESSNPLEQAKLFVASRNAHKVGTAIISGVRTVEYAGTYEPAVALAELSPALRKQIGPSLKSIGTNQVQFEVWLDAHDIVRRAQDTDNVRGQVVITNLNVTSVNQRVHVTLPPASQTAPLPK